MKRSVVLAIAVTCAGCGDALVTNDYRGEPLLSMEGRVVDFSYARLGEALRASIFWSLTDQPTTELDGMVEQPDIATRVTFPATFEINVFDPPPLDALDATKPFQIGTILVYADMDGDGRLSAGELRGGSTTLAIVYARERIPADASPSGLPIEVGFTVVRLPLRCGFEPLRSTTVTECGVPLGAACEVDADCGPGTCILRDDLIEFTGGYCALDMFSECRPSDGAPIEIFEPGSGGFVTDFYGKACSVDTDCRRAEGYECFQVYGACFPTEPLTIDVYPEFEPMPFCVTDLIGW